MPRPTAILRWSSAMAIVRTTPGIPGQERGAGGVEIRILKAGSPSVAPGGGMIAGDRVDRMLVGINVVMTADPPRRLRRY